jgi:hypothetical protein
MFNEEWETTMHMLRDKNHIELLLKIQASGIFPADYAEYLDKVILKASQEYLDTYGGETDV